MKRNISERKIHNYYRNLTNLITFDNGTYYNYFEDIFKIIFMELNYTTRQLFEEMAHPCESFFKLCVWMGETVECNKIFRLAPSSLGYCCSFNNKILNYTT